MKCQNVQIGDALYDSTIDAAIKKWPTFSKQSRIMIEWSTKRRVNIPVLKEGAGARYVVEDAPIPPPLRPSFVEAIGFEPVDIPELPHNVQFGYNGIFDILFIALRPGIKHKEGEA